MQMDSLGAREGVATYSIWFWISGSALSKQPSSSCFWYTDGLQPVKDLLLSTEGELKISLKFLQGKLMLWNRLLQGRCCSLALGHMGTGRCLMAGFFIFLFQSSYAEMALL